jgi:hypothetical protein
MNSSENHFGPKQHNHEQHHDHNHYETTWKDWLAFAGIIIFILAVALIYSHLAGLNALNTMRIFMAVFFLVFALFKLADLRGFANSYMGYDIIAKKFSSYAYIYPFIELFLAAGYLLNVSWINWITLIFMLVGAFGVGRELLRKSNIKCACLGSYVKLPLTTVSLIEDLAMAAMAVIAIIYK